MHEVFKLFVLENVNSFLYKHSSYCDVLCYMIRQLCAKIFSERDDLMSRLTEMRSRLEDFKSKDELTYEQVKKSVEMVEQAQLEQTQVDIMIIAVIHVSHLIRRLSLISY